jgi:hypothetical protein
LSGSTAPDVVYRYDATADWFLGISLCTSDYDTKVFVYENDTSNLVACNDDACGTDGFRSEIESVPVTAGNSYYVVVDGYNGDCGRYDLAITEFIPCTTPCPPGHVVENEPLCGTNYVDHWNGGCNSEPPVFSSPCSKNCGEYGGFAFDGQDYRDTDWYYVQVDYTVDITFCVQGELETLMGVIDGNAGCPVNAFLESKVLEVCEEGCIDRTFGPGIWWFFVAPSDFGPDAGPCGSRYVMTLDGICVPVAVEPSTWGRIKEQFRE